MVLAWGFTVTEEVILAQGVFKQRKHPEIHLIAIMLAWGLVEGCLWGELSMAGINSKMVLQFLGINVILLVAAGSLAWMVTMLFYGTGLVAKRLSALSCRPDRLF